MANIVAVADFTGQNNISNKADIDEDLTGFITKYEPLFLTELLGGDLYAQLKAHIGDARFVTLLPYLKLAIVNYVYWFYLEDQVLQMTGTGVVTPKNQNSIPVNPYPKMVRAWNEMVELNKKTNKFLLDNAVTYPEYNVTLPTWFYLNGFYPVFDWNWYAWYGYLCIPEIYRIKNGLGL